MPLAVERVDVHTYFLLQNVRIWFIFKITDKNHIHIIFYYI